MANTPGNEPSLESSGAAAVLHAPPTSTYQAWSRSFVEMYTIAHEWTIENFIELDEEASVCFKVTQFGVLSALQLRLSSEINFRC